MPSRPTPAPHTPDRWKRTKPLARCPNLACRREGRCLGLALGGNCIKTFHAHPDGWAQELADRLNAYIEKCRREDPGSIPDEKDLDPNDDSWKIVWKQVLEERLAEERAKASLSLAKPEAMRKTRRKRGRT